MKTFIVLIFVFCITLFSESFELSQKNLEILEVKGYLMFRDIEHKSGTIVFDVNKPIDSLMYKIIDLDTYPQKIEDVEKVEIYSYSEDVVKAQIFIDTFFIGFNNYVIHDIDENNYMVKWKLDDTKENYFANMQGYWKLIELDEMNTRVFYHNQLTFKNWIPEFIEAYLFEEALLTSTQWIKK